jgi:hypothetical protein
LLEDPWKVSNLHRSALGLHKTPWKFLGPCNVALGAQGQCGRPESGELAGGLGRGSGWEGLGFTGARSGCLLAAEPVPAAATVEAGGRLR